MNSELSLDFKRFMMTSEMNQEIDSCIDNQTCVLGMNMDKENQVSNEKNLN